MISFDDIQPCVKTLVTQESLTLKCIDLLVINRDLNGRVRLIVDERLEENQDVLTHLTDFAAKLSSLLGRHGFPVARMILFDGDLESIVKNSPNYQIDHPGSTKVVLVDRLATETDWGAIAAINPGKPRLVFFSIKGGVGRSTAMAATAWALAQEGKRVLVIDLDLESPGLSSSLLPEDRRPLFGVTDWLVEDLVENGDAVLAQMWATSELAHDGVIYVVPAHGRDPGEYVAKLGRVWMPKVNEAGVRESWARRLNRLIGHLEHQLEPDVILIDSRAGIDEVASACVTALGASHIFLFALEGEQTWSGYKILFQYWRLAGVAPNIRRRLQLVGAMIPDKGGREYFQGLTEHAWNLFAQELYDEIPPGELVNDRFSYDALDEEAPHYPLPVRWNQGLAGLESLHSRLPNLDDDAVYLIFGSLLEGVRSVIESTGDADVQS